MIPQELKGITQWTYSFAADELKRPKHSHYTPNGSLTFIQASTVARTSKLSFGFYTTNEDPYVIGDIDHIADPEDPTTLPAAMTNLLLNKGLYCEVSPSGEGIRFVGRLPNIEDKGELRGKIFYTRYPMKDKREAQINIAPPWLRFTGNQTAYSSNDIPVITIEEWDEVFALKFAADDVVEQAVNKGVPHGTPNLSVSDEKLPALQETLMALKSLPLDQNLRVQRAYEKVFEEAYSHYNFWLRIIMAVHDYASRTGSRMECLQGVVAWSRKDVDSFTGEDDVIAKWTSLSEKSEKVSFHTLFAVAHHNQINWPQPKPLTTSQKKAGIRAKQPMNTEYANFKELTQFYNIVLHRDSHAHAKMYLSGDKDMIDQYFATFDTNEYYEEYRGIYVEKSLSTAFHIMAQDAGFIGLTHAHITQHIRDWMFQITSEIDLVKKYFDTPYDELPESYQDNKDFYQSSTVEQMFACLTLDYLTSDHKKEEVLYFKYYKAWLMGLVRSLYWPDDPHMNNCVLLLTGKEQVRKTSHFRYMLPKFMREERIAFTTHGFSNEGAMRDVAKLSAGNSLLVWDEVEQYLTAETESNFKKIIDNTPQKFIDKYAVVETVCKPAAIYGATSNKREFRLSDTGSRRLFHIPVSWVATDQLDRICWHRIVNDLKAEIENSDKDAPPWLLTDAELKYQDSLHGRITTQSGLEILLREVFNFNSQCFIPNNKKEMPDVKPLSDPRFLSTKSVIDQINVHSNGMLNVNRAHLTKILHNLCGRWTDTKTQTKVFTKPKMQITKGLAYYASSHKLWVLPEATNPYKQD